MAKYQKDTVIDASPGSVFGYVADFSRHPEWAAHRLKMEAGAGPVAAGYSFSSVGHQMGMDSRDTGTVTEVIPDQRLVFETKTHQGEEFRHVIELRPEGGGTRVSKSIEFLKTGMMTKLMTPLVMVLAPKILADDLKNIKAQVESATHSGPPA